MFVIIIVAIIAFLLFTVVANCTFWVVSYWISSLCAAFANKDKKLVQGLSQTTILLVVTIFLFIYSYKGCTYVDRFGGNSDNMPVIGGWFLLLTGLISICVTFVVFVFAFDDPEKQKALEEEKFAKQQEENSKAEAEIMALFQEKSKMFFVSPEYKFVEQFAKNMGTEETKMSSQNFICYLKLGNGIFLN